MRNWIRKTEAGQFKPYVSEDNRFMVADVSVNKNFVSEYASKYAAALNANWKGAAMQEYNEYCQRTGLTHKKACWAVMDVLTGEVYFTFKTAKEAKAFAETLY